MRKKDIPTGRLIWLDASKGLAIILVVFGHCFSIEYSTRSYASAFLRWIYSFHMPVFFLISGLLIRRSPKSISFRQIIITRGKRLLVPCIVFSLVFFGTFTVINFIAGKDWRMYFFDSLATVPKLSFAPGLWFLPCLFMAEIIFRVLRLVRNNTAFICGFTLIGLIGIYFPVEVAFVVAIRRAMIAVFFMGCGYLLAVYKFKSPKTLLCGIILLCLNVLFCIINGNVDLSTLSFGKYGIIYLANSVIGSLAVIYIISSIQIPFFILSFFGENSLIVLCTHMLLIDLLRLINYKTLELSLIDGGILAIIVLACEFPIVLVCKKHLPKVVGLWK